VGEDNDEQEGYQDSSGETGEGEGAAPILEGEDHAQENADDQARGHQDHEVFEPDGIEGEVVRILEPEIAAHVDGGKELEEFFVVAEFNAKYLPDARDGKETSIGAKKQPR
jgi:hypothetical protein